VKYVDFASWFDAAPADVALLSTFTFDPIFFERHLLRCATLVQARRILILMDSGEWRVVCNTPQQPRWLNSRYLVVPVPRPKGVFHPKLQVLLSPARASVICGSGNLTRPGCMTNLELVNCIAYDSTDHESGNAAPLAIISRAIMFFRTTVASIESAGGKLARLWLDELATEYPQLAIVPPPTQHGPDGVELIHTVEGDIWGRLKTLWNQDGLRRLEVISPFFDPDLKLLARIQDSWPKCKVEITSQQATGNLPSSLLAKHFKQTGLYDVTTRSRPLHAKLLAWQTNKGWGWLAGSANFTCAAMDGRNVEACLIGMSKGSAVASLFDSQLGRRVIAATDFHNGAEKPECEKKTEADDLKVTSAVLDESRQMEVSFEHSLPATPDDLALAIRNVREASPLKTWFLPNVRSGEKRVSIPDTIWPQLGGAVSASLVAHLAGKRLESAPTWVVQPHRLTYIPSEGGGNSRKSRIEETGEGLIEFLDELAKTEGLRAVIEYLKLTIGFFDGAHGLHVPSPFAVKGHDPYRPDVDPEWLKSIEARATLAEAVIDFVQRHQKQRLEKHAARGNINGLDNFLDIFVTITRLAYLHYRRGVLKEPMLIALLLRSVEIATLGYETTVRVDYKTKQEASRGYLDVLAANLKADKALLQARCKSRNLAGHIRAALLIAQMVRFNPSEQYGPTSPKGCHPTQCLQFKKALEKAGLEWPSSDQTVTALRAINLLQEDDVRKWQEVLAGE